MKLKRKKLLALLNVVLLVGLIIWSYLDYQAGGVVKMIFTGDGEGFISAFESLSQVTKIIAVILLIIIEVIIGFIPGPLIYPFVGILVGPFLGSLLIIVGNIIGSVINFYQGKLIWTGLNEIKDNSPRYMKKFQEEGARSLFLLRLNPMTSFDFLPYFAGGSGMKFKHFFWANTLGLVPLIVVGTYFGSEILEKHAWTLYLLLAVTMVYVIRSFLKKS